MFIDALIGSLTHYLMVRGSRGFGGYKRLMRKMVMRYTLTPYPPRPIETSSSL